LGVNAFVAGHRNQPWYAVVNMFHGDTDPDNKVAILGQLDDGTEASTLKVVICSSALALGVNTKGVHMALHIGPPRRIADYVQQSGRAGREEWMATLSCPVVLLYNGNWLRNATQHMKSYCNLQTCRRRFLFDLLSPGEEYTLIDPKICCDICQNGL